MYIVSIVGLKCQTAWAVVFWRFSFEVGTSRSSLRYDWRKRVRDSLLTLRRAEGWCELGSTPIKPLRNSTSRTLGGGSASDQICSLISRASLPKGWKTSVSIWEGVSCRALCALESRYGRGLDILSFCWSG
jgi:hypothetical protein